MIASSVDPDRLAARMQLVAGSAGALLLVALPHAVAAGGHRGAFALLALIALALAPLLGWLPHGTSMAERRVAGSVEWARVFPVLVAGFLLTAGEGAVWAFLERIGAHAGVPPASIGILLGVTTLLGLLGAALAAWLGTRFGRRVPLVAGIAAQAAACWVITHAEVPVPYALATLGYGLAFFFVQPYLVGTAAVLDPQGRVAAAYAGTALVGAALGPALGGALVDAFSYPALGWQLLVASAGAIAAILPLASALDRASRQPA